MHRLPPELLRRVQRPARYVGGEPGQVLKDPASVEARVALCFPDAYEIGMSHLGLRILYDALNGDETIWCERAFAPMPDMEAALRAAGYSLTTLESGTPLHRMDVLGFSLQHELCFTNVLLILDLGGVPLRAADRRDDDPLVLAGGPTACHPEPVAPFFDAVALGDGEDQAARIVREWSAARREGLSRHDALRRIAEIESVYVPSLSSLVEDPVSGRWVVDGGPAAIAARVPDLDERPFPTGGPVPLTEAVFDRAMVEIARGCGGGCRFCQAGMVYRPVRERSLGAISSCLLGQLARGGFDEASLTSLSTADYSQVGPLVASVGGARAGGDVALSVSSLRAHGLEPALTEALAAVRTSSLTLAPEAATQRLRDVINKNIDEEAIIRGAQAAITRSRSRLKLYFMIGLPTETDDDLREIAALARRIQQAVAGRSRRRAWIALSASTFVPKPHTPLQWCETIGPDEVRHKQELLRSFLRPHRIELRCHDVRLSMLEALFARADRRAADLIEDAYRRGARFDGWDEHFAERAWREALDAWPLDEASQRAAIPIDARLPWDHLSIGPSRAFLAREYRRALRAKPTAPCLRRAEDGAIVCHHCGVDCDLDAEELRLQRQAQAARQLVASAPREPRKVASSPKRLRLVIAKRGDLAWLGHLDTARLFSRLLRRAGVELAYTRGFHPKPKILFASPLPVGMEGLAEVVDFTADVAPPLEELVERLRRLAPVGLEPRALRHLDGDDVPVTRALAGAEILLASPAFGDDLDGRVADVLARERLEVIHRKRGAVDVRSSLIALERCADEPLLDASNVTEPAVLATVALGRGTSIRPEDLARWLGVGDAPYRAVRARLLREPLPTALESSPVGGFG